MSKPVILLGSLIVLGLILLLLQPAQPVAQTSSAGQAAALLPLVVTCAPSAPNCTVKPTATATRTPTATATRTPEGSPTGQNYTILVGPGYSDVSPKQLVRTSGNRLYIGTSNCEQYPCTDVTQTLRIYRANSLGVPTGFTLVDSQHAPAGISQWAIAIDGSNTIHIVWNERVTNGGTLINLRYTTFSTTSDTWSGTIQTIDTALDVNLDSVGQGMQSVALALDASGEPHVVYLKGNGVNRRVSYRSRSSAGWSTATQIDTGVTYTNNQKAWHPNLAFDTAGRLLAVWERGSFNGDNDGTLYGRVRATNGSWGATVNISGDNAARVTIDQSTSLLITPDNRYHITWISAATDYIRYQYSDTLGLSWASNHPGGGSQATHNPALGYAAGKLRIYGHGTPVPAPDGHGDHLYFFESTGGAASWGGWTQFVNASNYDSSINVRWSQFFCSFPNTIDLAYWNDTYPNVLYSGTDIKGP